MWIYIQISDNMSDSSTITFCGGHKRCIPFTSFIFYSTLALDSKSFRESGNVFRTLQRTATPTFWAEQIKLGHARY